MWELLDLPALHYGTHDADSIQYFKYKYFLQIQCITYMHLIYFPLNLQCILKSVLVILWTSQNELGFFLLQYTNYINEPASIQLGFFFSRNIWFRISTCISLINYSRKPVQIKELVRTEQNRHTHKKKTQTYFKQRS